MRQTHAEKTSGFNRRLSRLRRSVPRFLSSRDGSTAVIFASCLLAVLLVAGAAVDYGRALLVKQRLQHTVDAAALAVGASPHTGRVERARLVGSYILANFPNETGGIGRWSTWGMDHEDGVTTLEMYAKVKTTFMKIVGIDTVTVRAEGNVVRETKGLEIVLVLDNSSSMTGRKLETLKLAARDLVNILFGEEKEPAHLKIGLVPFSSAVNVGRWHRSSSWIDADGRSSVHGLNFHGRQKVFNMYEKLRNKSWNGCVEARPMPHDIQDTPPNSADGDTLWVPYFAPDEPDSDIGKYSNNYLADRSNSRNPQTRLANISKYDGRRVYSRGNRGPHRGCRSINPLTPLTNQKARILAAIDAMTVDNYTNIPFGMAWGWRVISPGSPFTQGVAYDNERFRKVIILLSDGANTIAGRRSSSLHTKSAYSAYGYVKDNRLGTTNAKKANRILDIRLHYVCKNIKRANTNNPITIYTIAFKIPPSARATHALMRNCATDPEKYFESSSNGALREHFNEIARNLTKLRIAR